MPALPAVKDSGAVRVVSVGGARGYRRRLLELGFMPGTELRVVRRQVAGGTLEIEVRGGRVSLRSVEAAVIEVEPLG